MQNDKRRYPRILIIRLSALGDVVNSLPVASAIRDHLPEARVTWLVEDRTAEIVRACPDVDETIVFPRRRLGSGSPLRRTGTLLRYIATIRQAAFDIILDLQGNLKSGMHLAILRGGRTIGFAPGFNREFSHIFAGRRVRPGNVIQNRVEKHLSILRAIGIDRPRARFRITISDRIRDDVRALLGTTGYIVIHPGTSRRGILKRWRADRYAELATRLSRETDGGIVVTWGGDELALARAIADRSNGVARVAPEMPSLLHLAALLKGSRLVIGSDSGPLHLANAVGTPCLTLFGPKDPAIYAPYGDGHRVIYKGVECSPCRLTECDHHRCMESIATEEVFLAARAILSSPRS